MTKVRYRREDGKLGLDVRGHAGQAEKGSNSVCAGVSMLAWTLIECAMAEPDFHADYEVNPDTPSYTLLCIPDKAAKDRCRALFETMLTGYKLLAREYPDFVSVEM